jgi:hypothetical protein
MFELKPISPGSIAGALAKAERYRLLNEPSEAESICRDILEVDSANQNALVSLVLALADQIADDPNAFGNAIAAAIRLESPYDRAYYCGIAWERRAKACYRRGSLAYVYDWIVQALRFFAEAEGLRPHDNDDALLRWNTCVRFLQRHKELTPRHDEVSEPILSE